MSEKLTPKKEKEMFEPDWDGKCGNCEDMPTVPISGLCGPCHFGTAQALHGDWWDDKTESLNTENIG